MASLEKAKAMPIGTSKLFLAGHLIPYEIGANLVLQTHPWNQFSAFVQGSVNYNWRYRSMDYGASGGLAWEF